MVVIALLYRNNSPVPPCAIGLRLDITPFNQVNLIACEFLIDTLNRVISTSDDEEQGVRTQLV